jgi:hypothetical protein
MGPSPAQPPTNAIISHAQKQKSRFAMTPIIKVSFLSVKQSALHFP